MHTEEIAAALTRGATVLTGNRRAARTLQQEFDLRQRELGLASWEPPAILAWEAWTSELWTRLVLEGHETRLLLNRAQEHAVWCGIIAADGERDGLASVDALVEMAAEAWTRLCEYRGQDRLRGGISVDTRAFARWAAAFAERCRTEDYLPAGELEEALRRAVAAGQAALAAEYVLVGFDGWTPAREALAAAVRDRRVRFAVLTLEVAAGETRMAAAEDEREELACAARWLRLRLEADASARLALIVPGLEGRRAEVDRVLRRVLAPELEEIGARGEPPFELSLGVPLARTAMAAAALDLLRWATGALPVERVSRLLLSPNVAGGEEIAARAEFDAYVLRRSRMLRPEVPLDEIIRLVAGSKHAAQLPRLTATLRGMRRIVHAEGFGQTFGQTGPRSHADWVEAMRAVLAAAGWGAGGDSVEFQTQRRWESLLDELATLDFTGLRVTAKEALAAVERLAGQTLFAPESRGAPVQVMGPLESAGSVFDATWFLGAGEMQWPAPPRTNPLLAWSMQQELGMPGANAAADDAYARGMTRRIARCGAAVVFSYPGESAAGKQGASRMAWEIVAEMAAPQQILSGKDPGETQGQLRILFEEDTREEPSLSRLTAARELVGADVARHVVALEAVEDGGSLPAVPDRVIRGGAALLRAQAACGFRALAEQRLWATSLDTRELGMDARERGSAVHVALEIFWNQVRSQVELKALPRDERRGILAGAVNLALARTAGPEESAWDAAFVGVQRERLLRLLDAWLLGEMQREVPFTVKLSETRMDDARIGPLRLRLRVDRVDATELGDVVLDYKTGAASPSDWLSERPDEPQLPLYAVLAGANSLAGVAFAQVRAGKDMGLEGYQSQPGVLLKGAQLQAATLEEQVARWRECLTALAEDFHRGDARVRPKSYPHTCEFCEQRLLCRLDVSLLEAGATDEEADEDDGA